MEMSAKLFVKNASMQTIFCHPQHCLFIFSRFIKDNKARSEGKRAEADANNVIPYCSGTTGRGT
eukprot:scaffold328478_cov20-Prasinocladus_malaysianus.AAC.1